MRKILVLGAVLMAASPASAQEDGGGMRDGLDLLGEGSRMILEGLLDEMRPMMEDVRPFFEQELLPMLDRLGAIVDDLSYYDLPERLPNGDILIRRSPDAPRWGEEPSPGEGADPSPGPGAEPLPEVGEGGEVEL